MTFCPHRIVSTLGFGNSGFFSRVLLTSWESVHLGVCLLGICPLESLSTRNSSHVGLCPLLVLSTLDFANCWFSLIGSPSNWMFVYLDSVHLGVWPHDILPM